uniref:Sulfotransferase n=1 Tax=Sphaeramia orbicularis TaxID=375764 RepID=A0A673C549_9TELE
NVLREVSAILTLHILSVTKCFVSEFGITMDPVDLDPGLSTNVSSDFPTSPPPGTIRKGGTRALLEMLDIHPEVAAAPPRCTSSTGMRITPRDSSAATDLARPSRAGRLRLHQVYFNRLENHKPVQAIENLLVRNGALNIRYKAIQRSLYDVHMRNWLRHFPLEQIHIVDGDKVERFLNLPPRIVSSNFYFNQTKGFYCIRSDGRERCLHESKGRPHPAVNSTVLQQLRSYLQEHNRTFFRLVKRTFDWQ